MTTDDRMPEDARARMEDIRKQLAEVERSMVSVWEHLAKAQAHIDELVKVRARVQQAVSRLRLEPGC